ncbi:short chain amide porin [Winogradskyella eximia]|jgi:hypothetical protein|uniref:Short chain amide porin n=1 Tax=Winogradskyella eximia TaxID=262006 RepID=A0A3D9H201_9FLAO|nr:hypothetical protein [Winogradskyella eximia]RED43510.1 short chain amide porin [Winogradskyella eximia]|tara:strand:+ start:3686 stop:4939 length:1254 start_codon:yes stop_codon:yes gene_type:complete
MRKQTLLLLGLFLMSYQFMKAQGSPDYTGGLKFKFNEDGSKYLRLISWAQVQANYNTDETFDGNGNENSKLNFNLRRARVLMFAQINKDFLILTHFGLNSLTSTTLSPTGKGDGSQLFFHDVWAQYNLGENHTVGGGLHYFNGISRLNNQSTLNMMTLDNHRQSWATIGLSDQFARHLGVFAKGKFGKLQYRVAINDASASSLDSRTAVAGESAVYNGRSTLGSKDSGKAFAGYFDYHFFDQESNFLPYKVGTYLGEKKVFNVGAGFFLHPKGSVIDTGTALSPNLEGEDVSIFAVDAFYDAPIGDDGAGGAITAYAVFQSNDYGKNYLFSAYGTGSMVYGHVGYAFARDKSKIRYQPYASYGTHSYDAVDDNRNTLGIGLNAYMSGHNSKLTLEYNNQKFGDVDINTISLQAMIYL